MEKDVPERIEESYTTEQVSLDVTNSKGSLNKGANLLGSFWEWCPLCTGYIMPVAITGPDGPGLPSGDELSEPPNSHWGPLTL